MQAHPCRVRIRTPRREAPSNDRPLTASVPATSRSLWRCDCSGSRWPWGFPETSTSSAASRLGTRWCSPQWLTAAAYSFQILLIVFIGRGRRWARAVFLVVLVLSVIPTVALYSRIRATSVLGVLAFAAVLLQIAAAYLIVTRPGSRWFST